MYLFSNLKWRDPQDPVDHNHLVSGWKAICERFPMVGQRCDAEKFLGIVEKFHSSWQPNAERMNSCALFDVEDEHEEASPPQTAHCLSASSMQTECAQQSPSLAPLKSDAAFVAQPPHAFQELIRLQLELAKAQTLSLLQVQMAQNSSFAASSLSHAPHSSPILPPVNPSVYHSSSSPSLPPLHLNSAAMLPPLDLDAPKMKPAASSERISPLEALREGTNHTFQGLHDCEMQKSADAFSDSQLRLNLNLNSLVCQ